jgi:hypothetical protein
MSTQMIETNLELMKEDLVQYIVDEPLDILDEFEAETIADLVISIANRLMYRDFCNGHLIQRPKSDYLYKVNNQIGGFFSISDDDSTGVSRTEYKPFWHDDEDGWFAGLCCLASMVNEAWYHCNN